jgi:hypothetical protein
VRAQDVDKRQICRPSWLRRGEAERGAVPDGWLRDAICKAAAGRGGSHNGQSPAVLHLPLRAAVHTGSSSLIEIKSGQLDGQRRSQSSCFRCFATARVRHSPDGCLKTLSGFPAPAPINEPGIAGVPAGAVAGRCQASPRAPPRAMSKPATGRGRFLLPFDVRLGSRWGGPGTKSTVRWSSAASEPPCNCGATVR